MAPTYSVFCTPTSTTGRALYSERGAEEEEQPEREQQRVGGLQAQVRMNKSALRGVRTMEDFVRFSDVARPRSFSTHFKVFPRCNFQKRSLAALSAFRTRPLKFCLAPANVPTLDFRRGRRRDETETIAEQVILLCSNRPVSEVLQDPDFRNFICEAFQKFKGLRPSVGSTGRRPVDDGYNVTVPSVEPRRADSRRDGMTRRRVASKSGAFRPKNARSIKHSAKKALERGLICSLSTAGQIRLPQMNRNIICGTSEVPKDRYCPKMRVPFRDPSRRTDPSRPSRLWQFAAKDGPKIHDGFLKGPGWTCSECEDTIPKSRIPPVNKRDVSEGPRLRREGVNTERT
ncbi:hypothetical protein DFH07DRAFT_782604 [Mycena maculata]|uniref:Uncharacterized protein n=1 Tax=Mycena maculata TaxID=230809 RepID=A0AAD7HRV5_9AGAR|nr:hypothetical protein DFH07DRAFT_782604 [Mycena maculata]